MSRLNFFCFLSLHVHGIVVQYDDGPVVMHPTTLSVVLPDKNSTSEQPPLSLMQKSEANTTLADHENATNLLSSAADKTHSGLAKKTDKKDKKTKKHTKIPKTEKQLAKKKNKNRLSVLKEKIGTLNKLKKKVQGGENFITVIRHLLVTNAQCLLDFFGTNELERELWECIVGPFWDWMGVCEDMQDLTREESCDRGCELTEDYIQDQENSDDVVENCEDHCSEFTAPMEAAWELRSGCSAGCEQQWSQVIAPVLFDDGVDRSTWCADQHQFTTEFGITCTSFCTDLCCEEGDNMDVPPSDSSSEEWTNWWYDEIGTVTNFDD